MRLRANFGSAIENSHHEEKHFLERRPLLGIQFMLMPFIGSQIACPQRYDNKRKRSWDRLYRLSPTLGSARRCSTSRAMGKQALLIGTDSCSAQGRAVLPPHFNKNPKENPAGRYAIRRLHHVRLLQLSSVLSVIKSQDGPSKGRMYRALGGVHCSSDHRTGTENPRSQGIYMCTSCG